KDANGNYVIGPNRRRVKAEDNMEACSQCHGETFGSKFDDAKFFTGGKGDHDNDGIVEGLQDEVYGMVNKIMTKLGQIPGSTFSPGIGQYDAAGKFIAFPVPMTAWTQDQLGAYWNAITAHYDGSGGIHNPKYIITALKGAMTVLGIPVGIQQDGEEIPASYTLQQNYPNPFNPSTTIKFSIPKSGNVRLVVYDILGKEVATLVNNFLNAGQYNFQFNAANLASGIYLYRLEAGNFTQTNKMLLMK
ncbi:MAG: T9SS type A sorting domain-containing protein, partial [Bacteroidota bacterium]